MATAMVVPSTSHASNYHVFLSFRGQDTRHAFTGNLYKALTDKGIYTFIDDEELPRGEEITPSLVTAIQGSKIAIIVLSKDYASSSFCLDELVAIFDCSTKGQLIVIPVFYKVDPSDVRHHKGSYGDALAKHEKRFRHDMDRLQRWKKALRSVADLSGYHLKQGDEYEYKFIGSIVNSVSEKIIHRAPLHVADHPVGLDSRVAEVMKLLDVGSDDGIHMVGILGMGGVGKSTLARAVYNNLIAQNFDGFCYLENVREESGKHGLQHLQNILLRKILKGKTIEVTSWREGASVIEDRLRGKKVLLLLDDVDKLQQLEAMVGSTEWFGPGSRVIITTRDKQLLARHHVNKIYEVNELNKDNALQLLTWNAFKKEKADPTYEDVLDRVLTYASGLPLALELIGSHLFGESIEHWESAINMYKRTLDSGINAILNVSIDDLPKEEKSVFLDIACCLKGYELKEVEAILRGCYGDSMKHHIDVLVNKSLIKVKSSIWGWGGGGDNVWMHDLIQEMGRQIDHKESHKKPQKRKRLWLWKDIIEVLKQNKGTSKIEIIYLDVPIPDREEIIEWDGNGFKEMKNLKILIIKNVKFSEGPKCLPNSLRVLEWWGYPSNCLPYDFQPHNLVMGNLPNSCITSFELDRSSKMFKNLTVLIFDHCKSLAHIPDLSGFPNLEKLSFECCTELVIVHESIGRLGKLKRLSADGCYNLESFPPIHLTSLQELNLLNSGLESFPEVYGKMENIKRFKSQGIAFPTLIKELPISFVNLVGLQSLRIENIRNIFKFPISILMMPELTNFMASCYKGMEWVKEEENDETMGSIVSSNLNSLSFSSCKLGDDFFSIIGFTLTRFPRVKRLILWSNNFTFLPECFKEFQSLEDLDLSSCQHLQEIRGIPPKLKYLNVTNCKDLEEIRGVPQDIEYFNARNCESMTSLTTSMFINEELYKAGMRQCHLPGVWIPEWFDEIGRGPSISFWFRNKLPTNILCLLIASVEFWPQPMVFINDKKVQSRSGFSWKNQKDHTCIFELDLHRYLSESKVPLRKEWNHVEVTCEDEVTSEYKVTYEDNMETSYIDVMEASCIKAVGIHVFKRESSEQDIRFTNPNSDQIEEMAEQIEDIMEEQLEDKKEEQIEQQQNCIVSCLLEWACTSFPTQCSHCIIM